MSFIPRLPAILLCILAPGVSAYCTPEIPSSSSAVQPPLGQEKAFPSLDPGSVSLPSMAPIRLRGDDTVAVRALEALLGTPPAPDHPLRSSVLGGADIRVLNSPDHNRRIRDALRPRR